MPDTAGNSLATATPLNLTSVVQSFPDLVTPSANDYYRFSLSARSSLSLSLTGLDANADVELLDNNGVPLTINGVIQRSANLGTFAEAINTTLDPGSYFIRVSPGPAISTANYTLNLAAQTNLISTDILWRNDIAALIGIWALDETGFASAEAIPLTLGLDWTVGGLGDFNNDGNTDIIWRNEPQGLTAFWYMNRTELLSAEVISPNVVSGWAIGGTGDFNDDGLTDIVWRNESLGSVGVWFMNGATFLSAESFSISSVSAGWVVGGTGDFNGDGNVDLLWRNRDASLTGVWLLDGTSVIEAIQILPTVTSNWVVGGTGDFNRDGKVDILWRDTGPEGLVGIWLMDGTTFSSGIALPSVADPTWKPFAPYSSFGEPDPIDLAGNTPAQAFDIGSNLTGAATYRDRVGTTDTDDYFRFNIGTTSAVKLDLTGLNANLDLQLLDSSGAVIQSSTLGNLSAESISNTLSAGTYFIRVFPNSGVDNGTYALAVSVNNLPVLATNSPLTLDEQGSASIGSALLSVTDPDNSAAQIVYTLGNLPANGTLTVNGAIAATGTTFTQADLNQPGRIQYTHNGSETTSDRFTFTVSDSAGGTINTTTFSIQVNPVNDPPALATNLGLTLSEGDESSITTALLQITDPDSPATSLTYALATPPTNGTLLLAGTAVTSFTQADLISGNLTYRHNGSEAPTDQFTFTITDGAIPSPLGPTVFSITILPVNDPPSVSLNTGLTISEGTSAIITPNRLLATDPDGPTPITYTLESLPTNGSLRRGNQTLSIGQTFSQTDIRDGQLSYIHNGSETTTDSFQFSLADGAGTISQPLTFSINVLPVNDPPVLTVPGPITTDQNINTLVTGVQVTDADVNPGEVTVTLSAGSGVLTLGRTTGITFITGDGRDDQTLSFRGAQDVTNFVLQSLIYRSNTGFQGTDTISVTVSDGGNTGLGGVQSDSDIITLNVAPVNDPPVITVPGPQTVAEDANTAIAGITVGDLDAGNGILTASLSVTNGSLSLSSIAGITLKTGTGTGDKNLVFEGTLSAINTVLSGLSYRGDRDFNGTDSLTISVSDNGNTGNGISLSDTKTIDFTITAQNDAPVLTVPGTQSVNENTDLRITGISVNDVDVAAANLTVAVSAGSGSLSLNAINGLTFDSGDGTQDSSMIFRGTQAAVNEALRTLIYRANANFNGNDTVSISVSDGGNSGFGVPLGDTEAIAINVLGINNAPVITLPPTTPAPEVDSNTDLTLTGIRVADPDAGPGLLSVTLLAENGTLTLGNLSGLTFSQGNGDQDNRMTFSGTLFAINAALENLTYRSYPGFTNSFDRITLSVSDNGNTGIGVPLSDTKSFFVNVGGAINQPPVANNDTYNVAEEGTLTGTSVLGNDQDPDFTVPLTAQIVVGPSNAASFTLNANGTFTYSPLANFSGSDTFTYRAVDALGSVSNTATVVITVTDVNDPPAATNDSFTTSEDQSFTTGNVLTNDTDIDSSSPLSAQLVQGPANATNFVLNADGTFSYTPRLNFNGTDSFTYRAVDLLGATSAPATVILTVTPVNDAPIANNDSVYRVGAGGTLSINTANGVLANDTDVDGPTLTASVVTGPANGTLTLNANGSFTYQPNGNFAGTDTFTYRASDGSLTSNLATATISVSANNAPIANPENFTLPEDGSVTLGNVLTNDTDPDNNIPLTASLVTGPTRAATFTLNADGSFNYTPNANFNGTDSFIYRAIDRLGETSNPVTVSFNVTAVNDAPVAVNDTLSVSPGGSLNIAAPGILANDTDVDSPNLTAVLVSPTGNGTLTFNGNGGFVYRPNAGFTGTDSFTYRASDGSLSSANTATVAIVVDPTANTPPIATGETFTTAEDTLLTVGNVLANDTDPDNNLPLTASLVAAPNNAQAFSLSANGSFSYLPNLNFSGIDTFTYRATDSLGGNSTPVTVTFSVTPVNDAPVASNDTFTVSNTTSLAVTAPGILSNDTDVDSTSLSAVLVNSTTNGTLNLNADGSFTYRPNAGFEGVDSFTYRANDGSLSSTNTATVNITVAAVVNTPPTAVPETFTTPEDPASPLTNNVLTNDTDADGNLPLTATLVGGAPANALSFTLNPDGSFSYLPRANFNGVDTFTYIARDSLGGNSAPTTVTLSVTPVPDAPVAVGEAYSVKPTETLTVTASGILSNDTDADGDTLTASLVASPTNGTLSLNPDGSFAYVPTAGFSGNDSFSYTANDGTTASNTAIVTITVSANTPPTANPDTFTGPEDAPITVGNVLTNDTDPDGNIPLTASLVAGPTRALSFSLNPDGSFSYLPVANFNGTDTFTYTAVDSQGGISNTATVTFSVTPTNDLPAATNDTVTVNSGSSLTLTAPGILANDTDPDGSPLTASLISNVTNGTLALNGNGSFTYTPNAGFAGSDRFTYVANDGTGNSNTATVSILVNATPTAVADTYTAIVGGSLNIAQIQGVLANDTDTDSSFLSASLVTSPTKGTLTLNPTGAFTYVPNAGATGIDTFTYRATDGSASSTATVTVSLRTNAPPVANPEAYRAAVNGTLTVNSINGVLNNDTDPDAGTQLTATVETGPARGSVSLNNDGSFTYIPQAGFQGIDSFVYRASDGVTVSGPATVTLTVAPNNPPTARNNAYDALSGITLNVGQPSGVLPNDTDVDGDVLSATVVTGPANGTLNLNSNGSFVYLSNTGFQGVDTFTYRAFDGLASSTATVSISVILNLPPTAQADSFEAIAGQTLVVNAPGVLTNDNDPEGTLFAIQGGTPPANGSLSFSNNGAFTYIPTPGFTGIDSFTYQASDNFSTSAPVTVTITVTNNSAPTANADTYDVNQNNTLIVPRTLGVLANDTDPNSSQSLSASLVTGPTKGTLSLNADGSFVYTPTAGSSGVDSFTYRATDGSLNSTAVATITLNATSTPPTAQNDGGFTVGANSTLTVNATNGVLTNDTDTDGDLIRSTLSTNAVNGTATLNPDGSFVYRPNAGFQGTDSFTYVANDGLANSAPATVFVTVGGANAAPVVATPGNQLTTQNTELTIPSGLNISDPDAGNNPIQVTLSATNGTLTLSGTTGLTFTTGDGTGDSNMVFTGAIASINAALANLRFTPTTGFTGTAQIVLSANDQGSTGTGGPQTGNGTVTVNVATGATLVTNINAGSASASPTNLLAVGNQVFFAATDAANGTELWKSGGTAATTTRVADINTGSAGSSPANLTVVGNTLYYTASTGGTGEELYSTDLTTGTGATLVRDIRSGSQSSAPRSLVNFNGTLFFRASDGTPTGTNVLWRTDGTSAGTVKVGSGFSQTNNLTVVGNTLYFTANNGTQLWKTDGTNAGTVLVSNLGTGASIQNLTAVNNTLFFTANDANGVELWSSNGTSASTSRVADLNPGSASSSPTNLVVLNGSLYFFARDNSGSFKLFQRNTAGAITEVATLPSTGAAPAQLTVVGNRLFFTVDSGTLASPSLQLYSSDGSTAGLVRDINTTGNDAIASLTNVNGTLFFSANDGTGFKVFRSDGTAAGTVAASGNFTTAPSNLLAAGGQLFFAATDATNGNELWRIG